MFTYEAYRVTYQVTGSSEGSVEHGVRVNFAVISTEFI
jgi:hypothetical protein